MARIRPLLDKELDKDTIVRADCSQDGKPMNIVRIPNPKNESEEFSFAFNGVYDMRTTQEVLFTNEGTGIQCHSLESWLTRYSFATSQVSFPRSGRYDIRIRSYWHGENIHDERRDEDVR